MGKKSKNKWQAAQQKLDEQESLNIAVEEAPKMEFDAWYALRGPSIPTQHHREIIRADFGARGVSNMATLEEFDRALTAYGVRLA